ncbi:type I-B CRISPR-associated protein Cas8b1/Cst1 [uncultured Tissierella sp.]|uniref:type I-B CRISPR-associated protein Cas8b1/Cst1 n=1 Tax=uncultured Tissierella sp. TaxID=448160 RepID=UPI002804D666|nr:type I-B CRISPR-associated protein Cas8b1/Cst1 [uncultured Tissierella sp.]MDU5082958.1 type I-B CRISPR-associated protein Cas8b1/Cst1 [Bacillota bacterium]
MEEKIRLCMEDWLYNSGLVGFYNILKHADDDVVIKQNYIEFEFDNLVEFEEKYFNYFMDRYRDIFSLNKIISFEKFILHHEENNFEEFDEKSLEFTNRYITDVAKKQIKSNSYKSAYELIESSINVLELEKNLKTINIKKKQDIKDILSEIKDMFNLLKQIIRYMKLEQSQKYIGAKNAMYTIIKNGWNGVCFLNPQTKEKDMYIDYKEYFIDPTIEYLNTDKSKFKYSCFSCARSMKDFSNDLSFLNSTGFDVSRKSSHVWDFQNDIAVCPICKLIYSCVPAGITYLYDKGIYINDNSSMKNAIDINNKIYMEIYKQNDENKKLTYRALVESINKEYNDKVKYELADIQLVRYEDEKYRFNILSKNSLKVIKDSEEDLNKLINCGFKEINTYFNIYELVIDRLLNSQNMFTLVQKMLHYKLSQPKDSHYNSFHVIRILGINTRFLKGVGCMKGIYRDIVKEGNDAGEKLREKYRSKGAVDKLGGISYRLLNSLKTNNKDSFMDTLLNCYLYVKSSVPEVFLDALKDEERLKTIGYAFVAGLIEGKRENNNDDDENGGKDNE